MPTGGLREQHAELTRERILSAVAELLEQGAATDELTVPAVAEASGVSLRTVYRYYATRDELVEAASHWIGERVLQQPIVTELDAVAGALEAACADFDRHPQLVRAMALSQVGREVRAHRRAKRLAAVETAVRAELPALREDEQREALAVLGYLNNVLAYTTLREEAGLSGAEIGTALGWATRTLVADLRRRNDEREGKG